jgi:Protein of unknown function DUF262
MKRTERDDKRTKRMPGKKPKGRKAASTTFEIDRFSDSTIRRAIEVSRVLPPPQSENDSGLEPEAPEDENESVEVEEPKFSGLKYDPATIRVAFRQYPIDLLLKRISEGAINFNPGFQRAANIWNSKAKSRLIESLLIKIPLPVFYLDSSNEDRWDVIDGVQRLTAFKEFAVDKQLRLKSLEFMPELDGKGYDNLPRSLQRRLLETNISLYLIEKGTPDRVKQSIYERINTGGTTLVQQEIRHAIFQGVATKLLEEMASLGSFKNATGNGISSLRMADKECVLRFIAFVLTDYRLYLIKDMDKFLSDAMEKLSDLSEEDRSTMKAKFDKSMDLSFRIFGKTAFRKPHPKAKINKALFETISSTIAKLSSSEITTLLNRKKILKSRLIKLMQNVDFIASISSGTGDVAKVQKRFGDIDQLVKGVLS